MNALGTSAAALVDHSPTRTGQPLSGFSADEPAGPNEPQLSGTTETADSAVRRRELGAFLRARRARMRPEEVGLVPGPRRRTPGLRREEVAQLAGVGVTWYTWIEQGRPIRASTEVLDAIARTLRLDPAEREHLFRLADITVAPVDFASSCLEPEVQVILDRLAPFPASVLNSRYDLLAWNRPYEGLFPGLVQASPSERNVIWQVFTTEPCVVLGREHELPRMVATLRGAYGRHLGEPGWTSFVERMCAASPEFAELWARHDVAEPSSRLKRFQPIDGPVLSTYATILGVTGTPETRMITYTPADDATAGYFERKWREQLMAAARGAGQPLPPIDNISPLAVALASGHPGSNAGPVAR